VVSEDVSVHGEPVEPYQKQKQFITVCPLRQAQGESDGKRLLQNALLGYNTKLYNPQIIESSKPNNA
jgi:hypothetical protein